MKSAVLLSYNNTYYVSTRLVFLAVKICISSSWLEVEVVFITAPMCIQVKSVYINQSYYIRGR